MDAHGLLRLLFCGEGVLVCRTAGRGHRSACLARCTACIMKAVLHLFNELSKASSIDAL